MERSTIRTGIAFLGLVLLPLVSCDTSKRMSTAPEETVTIAPRLLLEAGVTLPRLDSVRIVVINPNSPNAAPYYDRTLDWNLHADTIRGIPSNAPIRLRIEGRKLQRDSTQAVWWAGSATATFTGTQTLQVQSLPVPVALGDTAAPRLVARAGDTIEATDTTAMVVWRVGGDSVFSVLVDGTTTGVTVAHDTVIWRRKWLSGARLPLVAKFKDSTGNVTIDSFAVVRRERVAAPTFSIPSGTRWNDRLVVHLSDSTVGASIQVSLDSGRTWSGPVDSIVLGQDIALLACAAKRGMTTSAVAQAVYSIAVATPSCQPPGARYDSARSVTLSSTTPGARILYTLDGSVPSSASPIYSGPISVTKATRIQAIAEKDGVAPSGLLVADYVIDTVKMPDFSLATGSYAGSRKVALSSATSGATIRYTLDGTVPTATSKVYSDSILVDTSTTLRAVAYKTGRVASPVATIGYTIVALPPTFSPPGGRYDSTRSVAITTASSGAQIRYTTDGSTPTESSLLYGGPVTVPVAQTIQAIAVKKGNVTSPVSTASYVIDTVKAPVFSLAAGSYAGSRKVALSCATSGATIRYTLDGTIPTASSKVYSDSILVDTSTTLRAVAFKTGRVASPVATIGYTIVALAPTFSPPGGRYDSSRSVAITSASSGASIYYTLDGSAPTTASTPYKGPLVVAVAQTIKAIAAKKGSTTSPVASASYVIDTVQAPTFSLDADWYVGRRKLALSCATSGARIYYTTDGSTPSTSSKPYVDSIVVDTTQTIQAIAVKTGRINSPAVSAKYVIIAEAPVFSPGEGAYDTAQSVTLSTPTPGAQIRYTTDGSSPTESSPLYAGPLTVSVAQTIRAIAMKKGNSSSAVSDASYVLQASAPTFTPPTGRYDTTQLVALATTTRGAKIYYTTSGAIPTTDGASIEYSSPIRVATTTTINAIATKTGLANSDVNSATITIDTVATPMISPSPGKYDQAQTVTITSPTKGASIYYRVDGFDPSTSSTLYTGPFVVGVNSTVRAIGVKTGMVSSPTAASFYSFPIPWNAQVTYGTLTDPRDNKSYRTVAIGSNIWMAENLNYSGAGVCYANSADSCAKYGRLYTWGEAMGLGLAGNSSTWTGSDVNQQGICPDGWHLPSDSEWTRMTGMTGSEYTSATVLKASNGWSNGYGSDFNGTDAFGFRALPGGAGMAGTGAFEKGWSGTNVYPSYGSSSGQVGAWWTSTDRNLGPFFRSMSSGGHTVSRSENMGLSKSWGMSVRCVGGSAPVIAPVFSPAPGRYEVPKTVAITTTTTGATIHYTRDGTTPTSASPVYTGPIQVNVSDTIKAWAEKPGVVSSQVVEGPYILAPSTPLPSIQGSRVVDRQMVTLTSATAGADIYYVAMTGAPTNGKPYSSFDQFVYCKDCPFYTQDSASVLGSLTKYTGPFLIDRNTTLEAIASKDGWTNSTLSTYYFAVRMQQPVFNTPQGLHSTTVSVTITADNGASIYYTTDGTSPTTASILYTGPIDVSATQTISAIAVKPGWAPSSVSNATYTIVPWNPDVAYESLLDARDGQRYRTVLIGSQRWMAQNLNYRNAAGSTDTVGAAPNGDTLLARNSGRYYSWAEAMGVATSYDATLLNPVNPTRGICPPGWHVPSDSEWSVLLRTVDSSAAITNLGAVGQWTNPPSIDFYGFRLIQPFNGFWTSDETSTYAALRRSTYFNTIQSSSTYKSYSGSRSAAVRCLEDSP